ncbi:dienelactone hydrolase family protein, partial [uncultured Nocardioides sp.]|uniref:dienelactone hydrolase family protein n=1 Tax=uncultured Nocardioides sp. TaxID=198441 RepID=UPI0030F9EE43
MTMPDWPGSWTPGSHTADGVTHPTYRRGTGPGVVVVHEIPGLTAEVIGFADELVEAGYTVVLPHLFGETGLPMSAGQVAKVLPKVCISREFTVMAAGKTSPVVGWLRDLARTLHDELGGPGVGALGMCLTGGFALAMAVDTSVAAPVLCQPSLPFPVGRRRAADLGLSPADLDVVKQRGCSVLGLQFEKDPTTGTRFDSLDRELGDAFIRVDLPGRGHSTVTVHRR